MFRELKTVEWEKCTVLIWGKVRVYRGESENNYATFSRNIGCSGLDSNVLLSVKLKRVKADLNSYWGYKFLFFLERR
jgi:hypothetical protein